MRNIPSQFSPLPEHLFERNKTAILRGKAIADLGILVKNTGMQSVYGATYKGNINVDKIKAENPAVSTVQKIQAQKQLRIDLERESSGMFALSLCSISQT